MAVIEDGRGFSNSTTVPGLPRLTRIQVQNWNLIYFHKIVLT